MQLLYTASDGSYSLAANLSYCLMQSESILGCGFPHVLLATAPVLILSLYYGTAKMEG